MTTTQSGTQTSTPAHDLTGERADLLATLTKHRGFLLHTVQGLTDEQATTRTTVSALTLGGLVKHVGLVERQWADFMVHGAAHAPDLDWAAIDWANPPAEVAAFQDGHRVLPGETLAGLLDEYAAACAATDELLARLDLDTTHRLPDAPWFEPGASWSVRRAALHLVAETAQHAGHADIIRESLDGQRTMG